MKRKIQRFTGFSFTVLLSLSISFYIERPAVSQSMGNTKWLVGPIFDEALDFHEGMAAVAINKSWGFIDRTGKIVIPLKFKAAESFHEGLAAVFLENTWAFIDKQGKYVIPPIIDHVRTGSGFHEGLAAVLLNNKWVFIDKTGDIVINIPIIEANDFHDGLAKVGIGPGPGQVYKRGFIDKKGAYVIEPKAYYDISDFSDGLTRVKAEYNYGFFDRKGKLVIQPIYYYASHFNEGLARIVSGGKNGFIDASGNIVIQPIFDFAGDFREGLAWVSINNKYGFIDKTGKVVIEPKYEWVESWSGFSDGLASVRINQKWAFIDKSGKIVIQPQFPETGEFHEGFACIGINGKFGFIRNPLPAHKVQSSFEYAGMKIGIILKVMPKDIVVAGSGIADKVFMGDRLCTFSGSEMIILSADFPMMTQVKCGILSGTISGIKEGASVYKYNKTKNKEK